MKLLVVGGGVAGAAAVHATLAAGGSCVWSLGTAGASHASSGALDWNAYGPDREAVASDPAISAALREFGSRRLGWTFSDDVAWVSTAEGGVRSARGVDAGVLDLAPLAGKRVALVALSGVSASSFGGWDAAWVRRSLAESRWGARTGTEFDLLSVDTGFAEGAQGEDQERLTAALRQALGQQVERPDGLLFGPYLASTIDVTLQLSRVLDIAVGECLSAPFGTAGDRFESAREHLEQSDGVEVTEARVRRVRVDDERVTAWLDERIEGTTANTGSKFGGAAGAELHVDGCVLATGGLVGGGVALDERQQLRTSVEIVPAVPLWMNSRPLLETSAAFGVDVPSVGVGALQRVGLGPRQRGDRLTWAGDLVADAPRTVLRAAQSGLDAVARLLG